MLPEISRFCGNIFGAGLPFDLARTRANGHAALGAYRHEPQGRGLYVLTLAGERISAMTRFKADASLP